MSPVGVGAIVTGGSTSLGTAVAARLGKAGAAVTVVEEVRGASGPAQPNVRRVCADVSHPDELLRVVEDAAAKAPLRIVVSCVSESRPQRTVGRAGPHSFEDFGWVVRQNLIGSFNLARLAAAAMARQEPVEGERGVIVMMSSVAGFDGQIGQAAYSASKAAIAAMVLPMARDLAQSQIRVASIAPGFFRTAQTDAMDNDARAALESLVPHPRRLGDPDEFAALVEHVVVNPMINGETIRLDGAVRFPPR